MFMALGTCLTAVRRKWDKDGHTDIHTKKKTLELGVPCALMEAYHQQLGNSVCLHIWVEEVDVFAWFGLVFGCYFLHTDECGLFNY